MDFGTVRMTKLSDICITLRRRRKKEIARRLFHCKTVTILIVQVKLEWTIIGVCITS